MRAAVWRAVALGIALPALFPAPVRPAAALEYWKRLQTPSVGDPFRQPLSVHADLHTGEIFVCDRSNDRIAIFDDRGLFRFQILGAAAFTTPIDLAVDPDGYIYLLAYVEGQQSVLFMDYDGKDPVPIPLQGIPEGLQPPNLISIAMSPDGKRLYLVDQTNFRLWIAGTDGRIWTGVDLVKGMTEKEAEEQILGHVDVYGDRVLVGRPMIGNIQIFDLDGTLVGDVGLQGSGPCQTGFPVAAAMSRDGNVILVDKQKAVTTTWVPSSNRCQDEQLAIGSSPGALYQPADIALDGAGRLYISQGFEGRVQVYLNAVPAAISSASRK